MNLKLKYEIYNPRTCFGVCQQLAMKSITIQKFRGNILLSSVIVTLSIITILVPYSLFLGWNLFTSILFWFVLVPLISIIVSRFYSNVNKRIIPRLLGCIVFYLFMIFMIYNHHNSDLFKLMIVSSFASIFLIWFLNKVFILKEFT